jgi:hypothetical protein
VAPSAKPLPEVSVPHENPHNNTGLAVEPLVTPISEASIRIAQPSPHAQILLAAARSYDVHWSAEHLDSDSLGVDIAVDAYRPRRLPASQSLIKLGLLVPAGAELAAGEHWLFAAPISASGLVPQPAAGAPRAAVAVSFSIGDAAPTEPIKGAVWLRKPEGTYNGPSSERVLFDALAFSADGAPSAASCVIQLGGSGAGQLDFPAPFSVLALPGGEYQISATASGVAASTARAFTVNPELGRPK